MSIRLWVVSAPNSKERSAFDSMKDSLQNKSALCDAYILQLPQFRVGTLDSLIAVADAISRDDKTLEATVERVLRQYRDLVRSTSAVPLVDGIDILEYVTEFEWDEAKFTPHDSLSEIRSTVMEQVMRLEEEMKIRLSDYTTTRQALTSIERRSQGNLMTRALSTIVEAHHVVETEHLTTVFVVFPSYNETEFLARYEELADFVVPRSAKVVTSDQEYMLYGVNVFKKSVDDFKAAARERRYTVRDFKFDPNAKTKSAEEEERLKEDAEEQLSTFTKWAETAFAETFIAMVHLKALRSFAESVLRYGLPVNFEVALLSPKGKAETRLRQELGKMFGHLGGSWAAISESDEVTNIPGIIADRDFYPYVYLELPLPIGTSLS
ncbi:V-type ATP synthase Subunit V1C [Gracilaria domingensis]|nr:V-type ATP synthase Subunit V1C [Gracilaria domingensis]